MKEPEKLSNLTIAIILIIAAVAGLLFYRAKPATPAAVPDQGAGKNAAKELEAKSDEQANVTVVATPLDLSPQSKEWVIDISMNTHSVDLSQDPAQISVLVDEKGNEYKPLKWQGPSGGHHLEGILIFSPVSPYPQRLTLVLNGIGGVKREFVWDLK